MAYSVSTLKELVQIGASLKLDSSISVGSLKTLAQIAAKSGSKIEIGFAVSASAAKELAKIAPANVTFVSVA